MGADFDAWLELVRKKKRSFGDIEALVGVKESEPLTFNGKHIQAGQGAIIKHYWTPRGGISGVTPPIQPMLVMFEGNNLTYEPLIYSWVSTFAGTGGFRLRAVTLSEAYQYTEASQTHGSMLQKVTFQRTQAKEYLMAVQNIKTAVINIRGDLEKIEEQMKSFESADWDAIKGLFIDNYGGPQRSWNASARNVPLVRMALTWFLRLKVKYNKETDMPIKEFSKLKINRTNNSEDAARINKRISNLKDKLEEGAKNNKIAMLKEIDALVKEEQMNPAIGNYIKRKLQEFWNWVISYVDWLVKSRNQIRTNLVQQKANLKLYMTWAADHIKQADKIKMDSSLTDEFPEFGFKGSPREIYAIHHMFAATEDHRPDIFEFSDPYVPVIFSSFFGGTSIEVQNKFTECAFRLFYGSMKKRYVEKIITLAEGEKTDYLQTMLNAGAVTEEEIPTLFDRDEIEEFGLGPEKDKKKKSNGIFNEIGNTLGGFLNIFGLNFPKYNFDWTKNSRAVSIATDIALKGVNNFKKSKGLLLNK